jgi:hypothetical protein
MDDVHFSVTDARHFNPLHREVRRDKLKKERLRDT